MAEAPAHRQTRLTRLGDLLQDLDQSLRAGDTHDLRALNTGFKLLDEIVGGGLHAGDLLLLGGPPGVGKTVAALQMARHVARSGDTALFVCYEHEETVLATRLLALEAAEVADANDPRSNLPALLLQGAKSRLGLEETLASEPLLADALASVQSYADRLVLVRASGAHTGLRELEDLIDQIVAIEQSPPVVFLDYLQKIPIRPEPSTEAEKVTRAVEALKDIALSRHTPLVAVSAVDEVGLDARRLRLHHLRGSSAVAFEADVIVMMNEKHKAVSKVHLAYDTRGASHFREWVVWSIEKNRGGPNLIDLEFRKDFSHYRFDPDGGIVTERLVDERLDDSHL